MEKLRVGLVKPKDLILKSLESSGQFTPEQRDAIADAIVEGLEIIPNWLAAILAEVSKIPIEEVGAEEHGEDAQK